MATKPEFLVAKEKMLIALATVSVAISSPDQFYTAAMFWGKSERFESRIHSIRRWNVVIMVSVVLN